MIATHPTNDQLRSFLLGKLDSSEADALAAHLEVCSQCEAAATIYDSEADTLVSRLHGASAPTMAVDPQLRRALEFVKRIGKDVSDFGGAGQQALPLGQLREYRLLEKLGEGGMGAVFKAIHSRLNKVVAIKILPTDKMRAPGAIARFGREMLAVGSLDHPHLIRAHDAGDVDGTHFLVMEYVAGRDLSQIVKEQGPLPIPTACEFVRQAALGLAEAHRHGLVHRDIKPSNLMLTEKGQVKVLDLGLALLDSDAPAHELTTTGQMMGTIDYMAPEQGGDSHKVDARADLYSLGATLYKLLTGFPPFYGPKYDSVMRKLVALSNEAPISVRDRRPEIPADLASVIDRMLAKDPAQRFPTAEAVVDALTPFCNGTHSGMPSMPTPSHALPTAVDREAPESSLADGPTSAQTTIVDRPCTSGRNVRNGKLPLVLVGGAMGGIALLLATILLLQTPKGTLRVEINDPSIEVGVVGTNVVVKQSDNDVITLSPGEKTLLVKRGGLEFTTEKFLLKKGEETKVKVELLPGEVKVVLDGGAAIAEHKIRAVPATDPRVAETGQPSKSPSSGASASPSELREKPFVLVRHGQPPQEFKHLAGALAELKPNDMIDIYSDRAIPLKLPQGFSKALHIRGAGGFRPRLEVRTTGLDLRAPLTLEYCDLVVEMMVNVYVHDAFTVDNCRLLGAFVLAGAKSRFNGKDSLLLAPSVNFAAQGNGVRIRIENCVARAYHAFIALGNAPDLEVELINNSLYVQSGYGSSLVSGLDEKCKIKVVAEGNIIHQRSQAGLFWPSPLKDWTRQVIWNGENNLYSGQLFAVFNDKQEFARFANIEDWNKLWGQTEKGSEVVEQFQPLFIRSTHMPVEQLRKVVEPFVESARQIGHLEVLGCNWDLVGPGDAYVRALTVAHDGSPAVQPEVSEEGPFALLRAGKELASYSSLSEALESAKDRDVVEIRTNETLPPVTIGGEQKRFLTIRAGAGYSPVLEGFSSGSRDVWNLEGLSFVGVVQTSGWSQRDRSAIHRISNCTILPGGPGDQNLFFAADGETPPSIVNSRLFWLRAKLPKGVKFRIENSVLQGLADALDDPKDEQAAIDLANCVFWSPEPVREASVEMEARISYTARNCYFASPENVLATAAKPPIPWQGKNNIFATAFRTYLAGAGSVSSLAKWQGFVTKEEGSCEALPPIFDAHLWRLSPGTPGAGKGENGRDQGADVSKIGVGSPGRSSAP